MPDLPDPTELLPHRPPFLFVDEILDLVPGESARARWHVDPDAAFFAGHFPGNPILPGVIIVEALAQTGALAALADPDTAGKLALLTKDIKAPNGLAFSPDESKLYISNADPTNAVWMVYELKRDGSLENGRVFYDGTAWAQKKPGVPDGMKVDRNGNIFAAGPGGIHVISPDGKHLGSIETGAATGNVAWGEDGSTLFITSNTNVFRLRLTTRGAGF